MEIISYSNIDTCFEEFLTKQLSPRTQMAYESDIRNFFNNNITQEKIYSLDFNAVALWRNSQISKGIKPTTLARQMTALHTFYSYLQGLKIVNDNPFNPKIIKRPKITEWCPKIGLEPEQVAALLQVCLEDKNKLIGARDASIIAIGIGAALRRSEIVDIDRNDINYEGSSLVITLKNTKGGANDKIPLLEEIHVMIENYLLYFAPYEERLVAEGYRKPLFVSVGNRDFGTRLTDWSIYNLTKKRALQAGITQNVHPHLFRHTAVTQMLENGGELHRVQQTARHKDPKITQRYNTNINKIKNSPVNLIKNLFIQKPD